MSSSSRACRPPPLRRWAASAPRVAMRRGLRCKSVATIGGSAVQTFPGILTMRAIVTSTGLFSCAGESFRAAIGRGGVRAGKQEGDGATPLAPLRLVRVLYRPDREQSPATAAPVQALAPDDGWCDDPALPAYNQPVRLPIEGSAERLWREDNL